MDPKISDATKNADRADAQAAHQPDRMPTPDEEQAAEQLHGDPQAQANYKEAAERGANSKGEGRITG